jgi:hypothetical protein
MKFRGCVCAFAVMVGAGGGVVLADPVDIWADTVAAAVRDAGSRVVEETIGRSVEGRAIRAIRVRGRQPGGGQRRPTLVVAAGLDGRHLAGSKIAIGLIERFVADSPPALEHADLVVIPCVNPDGMAAFAAQRPRADVGGNAERRQTARDDADRDRRIDEDGPADLNADGVISQMRVRRPRSDLIRGLSATEVPEADEPRLMRHADAVKGEQGEYAVLVEGRDQDGDGLIAEDAAEGVDLDSNFPYHWREFDGSAGPNALSEPESRAVAEWLLAHPEVVTVVVYGPNDNLVNLPATGKMDATGQAPISGGILEEDKALYEWAGRTFKETTAITGTGGVGGSFDGSLEGWAYAQLGVASFMTPGWVRPDLAKHDEAKADVGKKAEAGGDDLATEPLVKPVEKKMPDTDDGKWLALSDRRVAGGGTTGFLDWTPFEHPQLGAVEIGGWVPGFRLDAPDDELARSKKDQAVFVAKLLDGLPRLVVDPARVERVGERVWKISVSAVNTGTMPTRTVMGERARRLPPTRWELDVPTERVIAGRKTQGAARVASGASVRAEWVVAGEAESEVSVKLFSPETGDQTVSVKLTETKREGERP